MIKVFVCDTDLLKRFRTERNQIEDKVNNSYKEKKSESPYYLSFLKKYENLDENIDKLNNRDLVYYYVQKSQEAGKPYIVSNWSKDVAIMKRMKQRGIDNSKICLMIEFLYSKEQNYIKNPSVNVLISSWVNKLLPDSVLWANDEYVPLTFKNKNIREFDGDKKEEQVRIGEW